MTSPTVSIAVFALVITACVVLGVGMRTHFFHEMGRENSDQFWMESAQRFRYARMVADGENIPHVDRHIQWPDGLMTRRDTITQEYLIGWAHRITSRFTMISFPAFVRYFERIAASLAIIPIALWVRRITRSRYAAVLAAVVYAVAMNAVTRADGATIYREHIAIPAMAVHVWLLARWGTTSAWRDLLGSAAALAFALVTWKVMRFYFLAFMLVVWAMTFVGSREERASITHLVAALTGVNVLTVVLFDTHLRYDGFLWSAPMVLNYCLLLGLALRHRYTAPTWTIPVTAGFGTVIVLALIPSTGAYAHVWETVAGKLQYWSKPTDPALLSFHARHYWGPPYDSPTLHRWLVHFGILGFVGLPCLALVIYQFWRRRLAPWHGYVLIGAVGWLAAYVLFYKMQSFLMVFWAGMIGVAYGVARGRYPRMSYSLTVVLVIMLALEFYQTARAGATPYSRWVQSYGILPREASLNYTPRPARDALLAWLRTHTDPDDAVYADFFTSPSILTYADRPIVLNCFFESPTMLARYREHAEAMFSSEEDLAEVVEAYDARYYLYTAHHLLRDDPELSFRYVANQMDLDPDSAAYRMHFRPDILTRFRLVYQNAFFRLYQVGEANRPVNLSSPPPVFNEGAFHDFIGDNPALAPEFYRRALRAYQASRAVSGHPPTTGLKDTR